MLKALLYKDTPTCDPVLSSSYTFKCSWMRLHQHLSSSSLEWHHSCSQTLSGSITLNRKCLWSTIVRSLSWTTLFKSQCWMGHSGTVRGWSHRVSFGLLTCWWMIGHFSLLCVYSGNNCPVFGFLPLFRSPHYEPRPLYQRRREGHWNSDHRTFSWTI